MAANVSSIEVPDRMRLHTENTSHILLAANEAFLNPVQEFNRDTSIACITVWSEELNRTKEERWKKSQERKANQKRVPTKADSTLSLTSLKRRKQTRILAEVTADDSKMDGPEVPDTTSVPPALAPTVTDNATAPKVCCMN